MVVKNPIKSIYNFPNPFYNIIEWKKNKYKFNLFYKIKFINQLQSEKYETVFNITPERGIFNEELTLTSGARNYWKINKSNPYLNSILKSFYDKRYQKNFKINSNNEYELLDEIISQLNLNMNKSPKIENVLYKKKIDEKFIVISPFSSIPAKSWGINNYLLLAEKLSDYCKIYFIGTKEQFYILKDQAIKNQRIKNICGQLELEDIPSFMSNAKLFIGNDSGLTHLALFLKIPLIAIIGGELSEDFYHIMKEKM